MQTILWNPVHFSQPWRSKSPVYWQCVPSGELRSIPTGFACDSFLHIQREIFLPHGLPEDGLRSTWQLARATWRLVKLLLEVASLAIQIEYGRGPQLQSTCASLALAVRCWLHLVAARFQDADMMLTYGYSADFKPFSLQLSTWVLVNLSHRIFIWFSNYSGSLEISQLLSSDFGFEQVRFTIWR